MCRSIAERPPRGRRCPGHSDPARRTLAACRQRLGRHDRAVRAASDAGEWARLERSIELLDKAMAEHDRLTAAPAGPLNVPPTRAAEFTPAATVDLSDEALITAFGELLDDPAAQDQIMNTLAWRDEADRVRDAEIASYQAQQEADRAERDRALIAAAAQEDASPLTNPARRPGRGLSAEQRAREDYDAFVHDAYGRAETDCRGHLLSRDGLAKDIDPVTLFSGPASRVRAYASEELRTWFSRNGRITFAEWKFQYLGRDSDRAAAQTARFQSLGEATA